MSKIKKHFLRYLILMCMIVCIFTVSAFADEANPVSQVTDMGSDMMTQLIDFNAGIAQNLIQGGADMASGIVNAATGGMIQGDLINMAADVTSNLVGTTADIAKNLVGTGMSIPADAASTLTDVTQNVVTGLTGNGTDIIGSLAEGASGIANANAQNMNRLVDNALNFANSNLTGNGLSSIAGDVLSNTTGLMQSANSNLANFASGAVNDLVSNLTSSNLAGNMAGGLAGTGLSLVSNLTNSAINGFSDLAQNFLGSGMNLLSGLGNSGTSLLSSLLSQGTTSLSDLLTPWDLIRRRLELAAEGDFVIALYNPSSRTRQHRYEEACRILLEHRPGDTVCGWCRNIGRQGEEWKVCTLRELEKQPVDMLTTVFIGNSRTRVIRGRMVTPRGYEL